MSKPAHIELTEDPDFSVDIIRMTGDPETQIPMIGNNRKEVARDDLILQEKFIRQ